MAEITKTKPHTLMLDNRKKLVITGAEDVNGFNEDAVSVKTTAENTGGCRSATLCGQGSSSASPPARLP